MRIPVRYLRRFHATATGVWTALIPPTLIWWRESVPWLVLMSIYTIVIDHAGAWQASRAESAANGGDGGADG